MFYLKLKIPCLRDFTSSITSSIYTFPFYEFKHWSLLLKVRLKFTENSLFPDIASTLTFENSKFPPWTWGSCSKPIECRPCLFAVITAGPRLVYLGVSRLLRKTGNREISEPLWRHIEVFVRGHNFRSGIRIQTDFSLDKELNSPFYQGLTPTRYISQKWYVSSNYHLQTCNCVL